MGDKALICLHLFPDRLVRILAVPERTFRLLDPTQTRGTRHPSKPSQNYSRVARQFSLGLGATLLKKGRDLLGRLVVCLLDYTVCVRLCLCHTKFISDGSP